MVWIKWKMVLISIKEAEKVLGRHSAYFACGAEKVFLISVDKAKEGAHEYVRSQSMRFWVLGNRKILMTAKEAKERTDKWGGSGKRFWWVFRQRKVLKDLGEVTYHFSVLCRDHTVNNYSLCHCPIGVIREMNDEYDHTTYLIFKMIITLHCVVKLSLYYVSVGIAHHWRRPVRCRAREHLGETPHDHAASREGNRHLHRGTRQLQSHRTYIVINRLRVPYPQKEIIFKCSVSLIYVLRVTTLTSCGKLPHLTIK